MNIMKLHTAPKVEDKYNKRDRNIFKYALDESHRSSNITI
jgi:hypothetical protein